MKTFFPDHIQHSATRGHAARLLFLAIGLAVASTAPAFAQTAFTPGDLVVSTYGVAGNIIDGQPTAISLEEFTTNGTYIMTDTLPTTDNGTNFGIVGEYGSSSEANLQLSGDGHSLLIGGYQADAAFAGTGSPGGLGYSNENGDALAQSTDTAVPRLEAVIGANGVANITTQYNDIFNENNPRSVWSANGTVLYVSGQGASTNDQGIFTVNEGSNTVTGSPAPVPITSNNAISTRIVTDYNGNLYYSVDQKNAQTGIYEYSGIPTNSTASPVQIIPASIGSVNLSPDGFYFANSTTLYIADTGLPKNKGIGDGGIQKWSYNGTAWNLDYTLTPTNFVANGYNDKTGSLNDGQVGFESITGEVVNGSVDLFAVSYTIGDADADGLYAISDNLTSLSEPGNETFDELATAPGIGNVSTDTAVGGAVFKSVSFAPSAVPEPSTYATIFGVFALGFVIWRRRVQSAATVSA